MYKVWNEEVPDNDVGDVDRINDDVKVAAKSASGAVTTTRWDQPTVEGDSGGYQGKERATYRHRSSDQGT